jgi:hypothetical protein
VLIGQEPTTDGTTQLTAGAINFSTPSLGSRSDTALGRICTAAPGVAHRGIGRRVAGGRGQYIEELSIMLRVGVGAPDERDISDAPLT